MSKVISKIDRKNFYIGNIAIKRGGDFKITSEQTVLQMMLHKTIWNLMSPKPLNIVVNFTKSKIGEGNKIMGEVSINITTYFVAHTDNYQIEGTEYKENIYRKKNQENKIEENEKKAETEKNTNKKLKKNYAESFLLPNILKNFNKKHFILHKNLTLKIFIDKYKKAGDVNVIPVTKTATYIANELNTLLVSRQAIQKRLNNLAAGAHSAGVRIEIKGRIRGTANAKKQIFQFGNMPKNSFKNKIDYCFLPSINKYGVCGVKVWVNQGMTLSYFYNRERKHNNNKNYDNKKIFKKKL